MSPSCKRGKQRVPARNLLCRPVCYEDDDNCTIYAVLRKSLSVRDGLYDVAVLLLSSLNLLSCVVIAIGDAEEGCAGSFQVKIILGKNGEFSIL